MNDFTGKTVLITGATSGIGKACARRFAHEGACIIASGRNIESGQRLIDELTKNGGDEHCYIYLDMQDSSSIESCANFISEKYAALDVLVNNAGIWPMPLKLEELTLESVKEIFEVNFFGLVMLTKAVLPLIKKSHGIIINNASVAGLESFTSGQSYAYATSKSAIIKFTKMLAKQYGNTFRTNCICPGLIRTPIHQNFNEEKLKEKIPVNRVGEPEDVAAAVSFLASDEASFINGCVLPIDGGQSL